MKCKISEAQLVSDNDYEAAQNEEALATLRNEVLEHIQPKHPVMYDGSIFANSSLHRS